MSQYLTVNLQGGLGNQLFQLAAAYAVAKKLGLKFCLVRNQFDGQGQGRPPSNYYSTLYRHFEFVDVLGPSKHVQQVGWAPYALADVVSDVLREFPEISITLGGYFQSEGFFHDVANDIRAMFYPPKPVVIRFPELEDPHDHVFINVRRGDYLKSPHVHWPCGMTYYTEAMRRMKADGCGRFYIASDDMPWVLANFQGTEYTYLDITDDLELLYIMTLFSKYIISNSTYSWWGSFLSVYPNARCIAPDKWMNISGSECTYRDGMEIVERPVEV